MLLFVLELFIIVCQNKSVLDMPFSHACESLMGTFLAKWEFLHPYLDIFFRDQF